MYYFSDLEVEQIPQEFYWFYDTCTLFKEEGIFFYWKGQDLDHQYLHSTLQNLGPALP